MSEDAIMLKDVISPPSLWYKDQTHPKQNPSKDLRKLILKVEQKCKESKIIKTTVCHF